MRRLNVRPAQIDECVQKSVSALSFTPQNRGTEKLLRGDRMSCKMLNRCQPSSNRDG